MADKTKTSKWWIFFLLTFSNHISYAQVNNAIFFGGISDGYTAFCYEQNITFPNIFTGGVADGYATLCYAQNITFPNIFTGGIGDGYDRDCYDQNITFPNVFVGSMGDGYDQDCYVQNYTPPNVFIGNIGDGYVRLCYDQNYTPPNVFAGSAGDGYMMFCPDTTLFVLLPVSLLYFKATCINEGRQVSLTWATASEINNDHFTVERSKDGANWEALAEVAGAGSSNTLLTYSLTDEKPLPGNAYYRLVQTDYDGHHEYSATSKVNCMQNFTNFHIFPNPFWLNFYIGFNNSYKEAVIHIKIIDIVGKTYPQEEKIISEGYNEIKLDMAHLPSGLYYIELYLGGVVYNEKMVKLR